MRITTSDALGDDIDVFARARFAMFGPLPVWVADDGTLAWVRTNGPQLECLGPSAEAMVGELLAADPHLAERVLLRRPTSLTGADPSEWDYRWTSTPPPRPTHDVTWLTDDEAITALLDAASPTASVRPGDPTVRRWAGVQAEGVVVAVAADVSLAPRHALIGSVATHPAHRGRGLAFDVTSWLTAQLLAEGKPFVGLGVFADNPVALRLYDRLGFADEHHLISCALPGGAP